MSIGRQTDKKVVVHKHNGILLSCSKKNAFESVLMRWLRLETIIQSEVNQGEIPVQYINAYIWNLKMIMLSLYARQQKRHRYKEQTFGLCERRQEWDNLREYH